MLTTQVPTFFSPDALTQLESMTDEHLDELDFGVIGFDEETLIRRYNRQESRLSGFTRDRVLGRQLFAKVAPRMNNYMVAEQFQRALSDQATLDVKQDYVLRVESKTSPVVLRLLSEPTVPMQYLLIRDRPDLNS